MIIYEVQRREQLELGTSERGTLSKDNPRQLHPYSLTLPLLTHQFGSIVKCLGSPVLH